MSKLINLDSEEEVNQLEADALISGARWEIAGNLVKYSNMNEKIGNLEKMISDYYELFTNIREVLREILNYIETAECAKDVKELITSYNNTYNELVDIMRRGIRIEEKIRIGRISYGECRSTLEYFLKKYPAVIKVINKKEIGHEK